MKNELIKWIVSAIVGLFLSACSSGGSDSPRTTVGESPSPIVSAPTPIVVTIKSGSGFSCTVVGETLFCRGVSTPNLGVNSLAYEAFATISGGITHFEAWDDSLCITGLVSLRPYSRSPGQATYCFGESSLGPAYSGYSLVYSGPSFSSGANGSSEVTFHTSDPFVGGDVGIGLFTNNPANYGVMTDGTGSVSSVSENCSQYSDRTECPSGAFFYYLPN